MGMFQRGDRVEHERYGPGTVVGAVPPAAFLVRFDEGPNVVVPGESLRPYRSEAYDQDQDQYQSKDQGPTDEGGQARPSERTKGKSKPKGSKGRKRKGQRQRGRSR